MPNSDISLTLSDAEAIVLFELLSRFVDSDKLVCDHPAEIKVLNDLQCTLESKLVAPLADNYEAYLSDARKRVIS